MRQGLAARRASVARVVTHRWVLLVWFVLSSIGFGLALGFTDPVFLATKAGAFGFLLLAKAGGFAALKRPLRSTAPAPRPAP